MCSTHANKLLCLWMYFLYCNTYFLPLYLSIQYKHKQETSIQIYTQKSVRTTRFFCRTYSPSPRRDGVNKFSKPLNLNWLLSHSVCASQQNRKQIIYVIIVTTTLNLPFRTRKSDIHFTLRAVMLCIKYLELKTFRSQSSAPSQTYQRTLYELSEVWFSTT